MLTNRRFARDVSEPLMVAHNLARIYTEVLEAPLPGELQSLIRHFEAAAGRGRENRDPQSPGAGRSFALG
jgi:hypothetical protein